MSRQVFSKLSLKSSLLKLLAIYEDRIYPASWKAVIGKAGWLLVYQQMRIDCRPF